MNILNRYSRLSSIAFLAISLLAMGFEWPWEAQPKKAEIKKDAVITRTDTFNSESEAIEPKVLTDLKHTQEGLKKTQPAGMAISGAKGASSYRKVTNPASVNTPAIPKGAEAIKPTSVYNQLQQIIATNESLKNKHRNQVNQLQRINEQARIHQHLLKKYEQSSRVRAVSVPQDSSELLRQEKIRLIREQTKRNYEFLSELNKAELAEPVEAPSKDSAG